MGGNSVSDLDPNKSRGSIGTSRTEADDMVDAAYLAAIKQGNDADAGNMVKGRGFEKLPDGRLVGYRVSRAENGKAVSGADSRQSSDTTPGSTIKFDGRGAFVTSDPEYAADFYAVHDNNVIQKVAFKEEDITSGDPHDKEPELSVKSAEVLDSEEFANEERPVRLNKIPAVAYDNAGAVIPLSQRFHSRKEFAPNQAASTTQPAAPPPQGGSTPPSNPPNTPPQGSGKPPKPPISNIIPGNTNSATFQKNAQDRGMTPEDWQAKLEDVETKMFELSPQDSFAMSDDEFNKEIGDMVIQNMKDQNAQTQQGVLKTLPKTGKVIVIGDMHEQSDNLITILKDIQANPETNLDKNPDVKLVFLGDLFSASKTSGKDILQEEKIPDPMTGGRRSTGKGNLVGETINRLTSLLLAKYPDQVHMILGNHDMGVLIGDQYEKNPTYKLPEYGKADKDAISNDPNLTQNEKDRKLKLLESYEDQRAYLLTDAQTSHPKSTRTATNEKHISEKTRQHSIAIAIGDKSKGEKVRLFVHSLFDGDLTPDISTLKNASYDTFFDNPLLSRLYTFTHGHGEPANQAEIQSILAKLGVDEVYFGHIGPEDSSLDNLAKTDGLNSPVGSIQGGANYVDSQTKTNKSGYMIVDLDKDTSSSRLMGDVVRGSGGNEPAVDAVSRAAMGAINSSPPGRFNFVVEDMNNPNRVKRNPPVP